ncbi:MAG: SDR family oxidoreductase [Bacteroidota bacterium]
MSTILVTGATGHFGKAAIESLAKKGVEAFALVRSEAKAGDLKNVRFGDYDNYESLVKAFKGIDKLLFVSSSDVVARVQQHENVVKAAKAAGVKHVVYTSFLAKNEGPTSPIAMITDSHLKTEKWLKESGIAYTILKNVIYADYIPVTLGDKVLETGTIYAPAGDGKTAYVLRSEMAEIAANILTSEGHEGKSYKITNEKAWSYDDIAKIISEATGKNIKYVSPTPEEYSKTLEGFGIPALVVKVITGFEVAKAQGEFDITDNTVEKLLGRKPTSVESYLKEYYS